jgi:hypothetical protein
MHTDPSHPSHLQSRGSSCTEARAEQDPEWAAFIQQGVFCDVSLSLTGSGTGYCASHMLDANVKGTEKSD